MQVLWKKARLGGVRVMIGAIIAVSIGVVVVAIIGIGIMSLARIGRRYFDE